MHWGNRKSFKTLQQIQNSTARILMRARKHEHITPILKSLHRLPVSTRIQYKIALSNTSVHSWQYAYLYLKELITQQKSPHNRRSGDGSPPPRPQNYTADGGRWCFLLRHPPTCGPSFLDIWGHHRLWLLLKKGLEDLPLPESLLMSCSPFDFVLHALFMPF